MHTTLTLVLLSTLGPGATSSVEPRPVAEQYLISGDLAGGETALDAILKEHPGDVQARFGLGTVQFVRAVERLVQSFYKHGLDPDFAAGQIPFARIPVPSNPKPEPIAYEDLRAIFRTLLDDLARAEGTLALVQEDTVRLPIRFGLVRLDFDGDGKSSDEETLWRIYARLNRPAGQPDIGANIASDFPITFDRGDVAWLRGYAHLLSAFAEIYLAHDGKVLFEHTAHLFFAQPKTPYPFLKSERKAPRNFDRPWISDVIAFIHLQRYPVMEPERMKSALKHLEAMIELSRESWKSYLAEIDNDHEWIPNPKQDTVVPGGKVTEEMVQGWHGFLDEASKILDGTTLVPFWRDAGGRGVNFRKVFTEPRELDPILWVQGTAAMPYLENGSVTRPEFWGRLTRVFRGRFAGFALWFN
jgi:hypothetical protein